MAAGRGSEIATAAKLRPASAEVISEGMEAGEVAVWRWDVQTDALAWSANMEAIHRLPPGAFDGTFQSFARDIHPDDRDRVLTAVRTAVAADERLLIQYRLPPGPLGSIRWVEGRGTVVRDASGRPLYLTGICQDITAQKNVEAELALRARQQEAVVELGERALSGAKRDDLFGDAVALVVELAEADYAEVLELSQNRDRLMLRAGHGWMADIQGESAATSQPNTLAGVTLRSKHPVVVSDFAADERFERGDRLQAHGVQSGACVMIPGTEGNPFGVIAVYCKRIRCISATDVRFLQNVANVLGSALRAVQDQERKELLIGELRHRVGNLFSLVQALHRQTGQSATDARDLEMKFGARLTALASAHALILEGGWQTASLRSLLETTLAPYRERVMFSGTDVQLPADAAFSFSMALHELATNANKYGSLSGEHGKLVIDCQAVPDALGQKLILVWKEKDGPPPKERETPGFGSRLVSQVVERQLGGQFRRELEPDGLRITLEFPLNSGGATR